MIKGLTRKQATNIAKTYRKNPEQEFTIWEVNGEVQFDKKDEVISSNRYSTYLTTSWEKLIEQQPRLTQAKLGDMIYRKVNKEN